MQILKHFTAEVVLNAILANCVRRYVNLGAMEEQSILFCDLAPVLTTR
jgi:hypothetical protein